MSMKRTSLETSPDDKENEIDPILQHDDDCKRVKLTSPSDTKLEDLPLELIHSVFVKAIIMEVEEMYLVKSVWKEKADLVISRLKTVCPHWSNILTTDIFQNELYRTLYRTAEKTIRLEIVHQSPIHCSNIYMKDAITLKDELFILYKDDQSDYFVDVYDRNNLTGTRDFVYLRGLEPRGLAACSVSNCLYVICTKSRVERITKEDEHKFTISPLIKSFDWWNLDGVAITASGNIILYQRPHVEQAPKVVVYDANGVLQRNMKLPSDMNWLKEIVPMPSGNLLILSAKDIHGLSTILTEMDMKGTVLRQYQSSLVNSLKVYPAGPCGRVVIFKSLSQFNLLDKEFNLLNAIGPQLEEDKFWCCTNLNYNGEWNELVTILADGVARFLTLLQFTEK